MKIPPSRGVALLQIADLPPVARVPGAGRVAERVVGSSGPVPDRVLSRPGFDADRLSGRTRLLHPYGAVEHVSASPQPDHGAGHGSFHRFVHRQGGFFRAFVAGLPVRGGDQHSPGLCPGYGCRKQAYCHIEEKFHHRSSFFCGCPGGRFSPASRSGPFRYSSSVHRGSPAVPTTAAGLSL